MGMNSEEITTSRENIEEQVSERDKSIIISITKII
jgi:hypothetical protein